MPVQCTCKRCGALFSVKASRFARGNVGFCSRACQFPERAGLICAVCGTSFQAHGQRRLRAQFCSVACKAIGVPDPAISSDGHTARVPLRARNGSVRAHALIDAADIDLISRERWLLNDTGYVQTGRMVDGKRVTVRLHREILGLALGDDLEGDHINRDKLDNRRANLRIVPREGRPNAQNRPNTRGSISEYRGVTKVIKNGRTRWRATSTINGVRTHLGYFKAEADAGQAALDARRRHMPYSTD